MRFHGGMPPCIGGTGAALWCGFAPMPPCIGGTGAALWTRGIGRTGMPVMAENYDTDKPMLIPLLLLLLL